MSLYCFTIVKKKTTDIRNKKYIQNRMQNMVQFMEKYVFKYPYIWGFPAGSVVKNLPAVQEMQV